MELRPYMIYQDVRFLIPCKQVKIDVDYAESSRARGLVVDVMLPSRTVMDLVDVVFLFYKDSLPDASCRALALRSTLQLEGKAM